MDRAPKAAAEPQGPVADRRGEPSTASARVGRGAAAERLTALADLARRGPAMAAQRQTLRRLFGPAARFRDEARPPPGPVAQRAPEQNLIDDSWHDAALGFSLIHKGSEGGRDLFEVVGRGLAFSYDRAAGEYVTTSGFRTKEANVVKALFGLTERGLLEFRSFSPVLARLKQLDPQGTVRDLIFESTVYARLVLDEYAKRHGAATAAAKGPAEGKRRGDADRTLLKSLLAGQEYTASGLGFFELLGGGGGEQGMHAREIAEGIQQSDPRLKHIHSIIDVQSEKDELVAVYGLTKPEVRAIEGYSLPYKHQRQKGGRDNEHFMGPADHWSPFADGWTALQSALDKLPSLGELEAPMTSYRTPRDNTESRALASARPGTQIAHGYYPTPRGHHHIMSTALTYSSFTGPDKVADAGGVIGITGTSGRYISPFSAQGTATDGAEILYPAGTRTRYVGRQEGGYRARGVNMPVNHLQEVGPHDPPAEVVDDHRFVPVADPRRARGTAPEARRAEVMRNVIDAAQDCGFVHERRDKLMERLRAATNTGACDQVANEVTALKQEQSRRISEMWAAIPADAQARVRQQLQGLVVLVRGQQAPLARGVPERMTEAELGQLRQRVQAL